MTAFGYLFERRKKLTFAFIYALALVFCLGVAYCYLLFAAYRSYAGHTVSTYLNVSIAFAFSIFAIIFAIRTVMILRR